MASFSDGATHTINQSYSDGEQIAISNGSTVIIDADTFIPTTLWGAVINATNGTFKLKNAGTNMLVFSTRLKTDNIRCEIAASWITEGSLIEVATGDGTSGQTIDFSSVGDNNISLDEVSVIWIEETAGGKKWPFCTLGDPSADYRSMPLAGESGQQGIGQTGFGGAGASTDWAVGRVFNFNRTTKVATFGDGTNGLVIPNGCKAYINNIQITCAEYDANQGNRSTIDVSVAGLCDFKNTDITSSIYALFQSARSVTFDTVSVCGYTKLRDVSETSINEYAVAIDTRTTNTTYPRFDVETPQGPTAINGLYVDTRMDATSNRNAMDFDLGSCTEFKNVYLQLLAKDSGHYIGNVTTLTNITAENIFVTGGHLSLNNVSNSTILNYTHRATPFASQITTTTSHWRTASYTMRVGGVGSNSKFINIKQATGALCASNGIEINLFQENHEFFNCEVDSTSAPTDWAASGYTNNGVNNKFINCSAIGYYTGYAFNMSADSIGSFINNGIGSRRSYLSKNTITQMISGGTYQDRTSGTVRDIGVMLLRKSDQVSNGGSIQINSQGFTDEADFIYELGGGAYYNNSVSTYLPNIGSYFILGNRNPIKGFTGFMDYFSSFSASGLSADEMNFYFKISKASDELPATWTQLTTTGSSSNQNFYTQLQPAFTALSNYDSDEGINFAFKVENASDANSGRYFNHMQIACTVDLNYTALDASITFEGGDATEKYEVIKASDDSVMYTFTGTGTYEFALGNNFGVEVYFKRYKYVDGAYVLLVNTQYTSQPLAYGDNGNILLYTGGEVQTASTDPATIWNYGTRTTTEGFTSSDRDTLNKGLTTGKFLALK